MSYFGCPAEGAQVIPQLPLPYWNLQLRSRLLLLFELCSTTHRFGGFLLHSFIAVCIRQGRFSLVVITDLTLLQKSSNGLVISLQHRLRVTNIEVSSFEPRIDLERRVVFPNCLVIVLFSGERSTESKMRPRPIRILR